MAIQTTSKQISAMPVRHGSSVLPFVREEYCCPSNIGGYPCLALETLTTEFLLLLEFDIGYDTAHSVPENLGRTSRF